MANKSKKRLSSISLEMDSWTPGDLLLGDYSVQSILGRGGMGTVYLVKRLSDSMLFALKTLPETKLTDMTRRRAFFNELRTWIDLPEYPHLVACRFFRTIKHQLAIFAEYVNGGSLHHFIRKKKLQDLEKIIDVAIQIAWGLHAAHENDVIHQDVKPANVLITDDNLVKVTDFGLARARQAGGIDPNEEENASSNTVNTYGMTVAYCSPEQGLNINIDHRTDIWSYGLTVLEMFAGELTWNVGFTAQSTLESFIHQVPSDDMPKIPESVIRLLYRCFQENPVDRWESMLEIANELILIYKHNIGKPYHRKQPEIKKQPKLTTTSSNRRPLDKESYHDPMLWLTRINKEIGEKEEITLERKGSRKAQALADLELYEEAAQKYSELIMTGRDDLVPELGRLLFYKSLVHQAVGDLPGAEISIDRSISIWEKNLEKDSSTQTAYKLAKTYLSKANILRETGKYQIALSYYTKAIELIENNFECETSGNFSEILSHIYLNKAITYQLMEDTPSAINLYNQILDMLEKKVFEEGDSDLSLKLANTYMEKGKALSGFRDYPAALELYNKAILLWIRQVDYEARTRNASHIAALCLNKALAYHGLGNYTQALLDFDQAIKLLEQIVRHEGWMENGDLLATALTFKAHSLSQLGDHRNAMKLYDNSIQILERLVYLEGHDEFSDDLAMGYLNKAETQSMLLAYNDAFYLYQKAIKIWERLIATHGHTELKSRLFRA
ncbi:protein kinase, partial [bacterium]|nr:protein kinase [candidate division CSSED10-310 bacterium]